MPERPPFGFASIDDVLTLARSPGEDSSQPTTAFGEAKRGAVAAFERNLFRESAGAR